jgi:hypothetical protein
LKNAIPYEHVDFWLSQMFIIKKQSAEEFSENLRLIFWSLFLLQCV